MLANMSKLGKLAYSTFDDQTVFDWCRENARKVTKFMGRSYANCAR